ncbi:cell division control protein [Paramecium bursaria]
MINQLIEGTKKFSIDQIQEEISEYGNQNIEEQPAKDSIVESYNRSQNSSQQSGPQQKNEMCLNILIVGPQKCGKSTFIETMPIQNQITHKELNNQETILIYNFQEIDSYNIEQYYDSYKFVKSLILNQFKKHKRNQNIMCKNKELYYNKIDTLIDDRIHCVLYFLQPKLNIDNELKYLQKLAKIVNVIPIIPKADQYTVDEILAIKKQYTKKFEEYKIDLFDCLKPLDKKLQMSLLNNKFGSIPPFVIMASNEKSRDKNGNVIQGRKYPWGIVNCWDNQYSQLSLFNQLLQIYSQNLIYLTSYYQSQYFQNLSLKKKQKRQQLIIQKIIGGFFSIKF